MRTLRISTYLALLSAIAPLALHAQAHVFTTSATVVAPVSLITTHSLDFGLLLVGTNKTVTATAPTSARAEITGLGGQGVSLTLSLPNTLSSTTNTLTINNWTYIVHTAPTLTGGTTGSATTATTIVPLTLPGTSNTAKLYVGIGATVSAGSAQPPGDYSGSGTLTVAYTDI